MTAGKEYNYTYDAMGQLLTETVNGEVVNTMTYDSYGNIVNKNGVAYTYGDSVWKDRLTAYDGEAITYDAQGNPVNYLGHTLTWEKGRQLKSFDNIQYTYNANGIRTSKTVNGAQHTYALEGNKILQESWSGNTLVPLYDNEDSVCGVLYNNTPFYFQKNLQGDVIAIANADGSTVARYSYDAWGKCTVLQDTSGRYIASVNPFRYRGYYYDSEIGMYYLQSRYYDPEIGRFLNVDDPEYVTVNMGALTHNLFVYCDNSVTVAKDADGKWLIQAICAVAGAAIFGTAANIICRLLGVDKTARALITTGFALLGGLLGAFFGRFLSKLSLKLVKWLQNLEKTINKKSRIRPMFFEGGVAIGWVWDDKFNIMLHFKHTGEPEKGMHIVILRKKNRNWKKTYEIPIKKLGQAFINWVKQYLK